VQDRSAQEIWEATLGELQVQVSRQNYRTWLEKTAGLSCQDNQFVVGVPNTFIAEYLDKKQRSLIEKTLIGLTRRDLQVIFQVDNGHQKSFKNNGSRGETATAGGHSHCMLNSKYTFGSFIVGNCNRLAHAAALRIPEEIGSSYNPLFIYGGVGLGKTHLLHAIGHAAQGKHIKLLYVSAERFTNEFINAIYERKTDEFHSKYRSVDMLLIDDIHFLCGKEQTEESFFHTFNELHNIVTAELISRIKSGEASTADLKAACDWLAKNDITGVAMEGSPLDQLVNILPKIDPELVRSRMNGTRLEKRV